MPVRPILLPLVLLGVTASLCGQTPPAAIAQTAAPVPAGMENTAPTPEYDVRAEAVLQKAADKLLAARSFSGTIEEVRTQPALGSYTPRILHTVKRFFMQRPNLVFESQLTEIKNSDGTVRTASALTRKVVSDGKTGVITDEQRTSYQKVDTSSKGFADRFRLNFHEFFDPAHTDAAGLVKEKRNGSLQWLRLLPDEKFAGVTCAVVEKKVREGRSRSGAITYRTTKIYVGKDDIVRGYHTIAPALSGTDEVDISDVTMTDVVMDAAIPASVFAVNVAGYKEIVPVKEPELLAAGTMAPDFTAYDKSGKTVKLSDFKGKIVVLDFWATWCGPCMQSLPDTTDVAKDKADKGVVVLAVNVWDTKAAFDKWLPLHPEYAPLHFVIDTTPGQGQDVATKLYKVWGIPTQYVVDRNGKIVASLVSRPKAELEDAIVQADAPTAVAQK